MNQKAYTRASIIRSKAAYLVLFLGVLLTVASAIIVSRLRPDSSLSALFASNDPAAVAAQAVFDRFSSVQEMLILATTPSEHPEPSTLQAFAERLETAIHEDAHASAMTARITWRADPQTKAFFENVLAKHATFYLSNQGFAAAKQRLTRDEIFQRIAQDRAMLAAPGPAAQGLSQLIRLDPLGLHEFIVGQLQQIKPIKTYENSDAFLSPDGRSILIRLAGKQPISNLQFDKNFTAAIQALARQVNTDHLSLAFTGAYPIATASAAGIRADMIGSVVGSVVLLQLLFLLAYRRPIRSFLLAIVPISVGILWGFAAYALLGRTLTPATAAIGGILGGMGIDYSIQFLSHFDRHRLSGIAHPAIHTLRTLWPALLGAWGTSVIGFLAIGAANVKALRDFSILGTLGLSGAFLSAMLFLPAFLIVTRGNGAPGKPIQRISGNWLLAIIHRIRLPILLVGAAMLVASIVVLAIPGRRLTLDNDLSAMHPQPNPPLAAQAELARRMGASPEAMVVYLHARDSEQLLSLAHRVKRRLRSPSVRGAGVTSTFGLASLLPDPLTAKKRLTELDTGYAKTVIRNLRDALQANGFNPDAFKPYMSFLDEMLSSRAIPRINDLMQYPSLARLVLPRNGQSTGLPTAEALTYVFVSTPSENRAARDRTIDAIRTALGQVRVAKSEIQNPKSETSRQSSIPAIPKSKIRNPSIEPPAAILTGIGVLAHDAQINVQAQLPRLLIVGIAAIIIFLLLLFQRPLRCLLAIAPMIFSLVVLLAYMRLSHVGVNTVNLVALPLLLGIDVDYGVFVVASIARKRSISTRPASDKIGPSLSAIVLCAAATIMGFVSLIFTSVPAIQSLGLLVTIGILACLFGVICLVACLPALGHENSAMPTPPMADIRRARQGANKDR